MKLRLADMFAGIGGTRLGFDRAFGDSVETVYVCELDPYARKTYFANFDIGLTVVDSDITKVDEKVVPKFDICLACFPCQAFSIAGKCEGLKDNYKGASRGILFLDLIRICERIKPKVIFCENVKGLIIHDKHRTLKVIVDAFQSIGYKVNWKMLNSKDYGLAQKRDRLYIVCFREDIDSTGFEYPAPREEKTTISEIMEDAPIPAKYYLSKEYWSWCRRHRERHEAKGNGFGYIIRDIKGIAGTLVSGGMGRERNLIIDNRPHERSAKTNEDDVRKMTPRECARLQGFPDSYKLPVADTHLYKQLGNAVSVNVVEDIAVEIKKVLSREDEGE